MNRRPYNPFQAQEPFVINFGYQKPEGFNTTPEDRAPFKPTPIPVEYTFYKPVSLISSDQNIILTGAEQEAIRMERLSKNINRNATKAQKQAEINNALNSIRIQQAEKQTFERKKQTDFVRPKTEIFDTPKTSPFEKVPSLMIPSFNERLNKKPEGEVVFSPESNPGRLMSAVYERGFSPDKSPVYSAQPPATTLVLQPTEEKKDIKYIARRRFSTRD